MKSSIKFLLIALSGTLFATVAQADFAVSFGNNSSGFYYRSSANKQANVCYTQSRRVRNFNRNRDINIYVGDVYQRRYNRSGGRIYVASPNKRVRNFNYR